MVQQQGTKKEGSLVDEGQAAGGAFAGGANGDLKAVERGRRSHGCLGLRIGSDGGGGGGHGALLSAGPVAGAMQGGDVRGRAPQRLVAVALAAAVARQRAHRVQVAVTRLAGRLRSNKRLRLRT